MNGPTGKNDVPENEIAKLKNDLCRLESMEAELRLLTDNVSDVIWTMDLDLNFTYISPAVTRLRGWSVQEAMNRSLEGMFEEKWRGKIQSRFREELERERTEGPDPERFLTMEVEQTNARGESVWIEFTARFLRDANLRAIGVVGMTRDIDDRKKTEEVLRKTLENLEATVIDRTRELEAANERLRKAHNLQRSVMESTSDGILVVDNNGKVVLWNKPFMELWGLRTEEVADLDDETVRRSVLDKLVDPNLFLNRIDEILAQCESVTDFLDFKDGRHIERKAYVLKSDSETIGRLWSFRDVTEATEALKMLAESEFRYRQLVDQSPVSIQVLDHEGKTIQVNRAWEKMWDLTLDDVRDFSFFHSPTIRKMGVDKVIRAALKGIDQYIKEIRFNPKIDFEKGKPKWIRLRAYPVHDAKGDIRHAIALQEDITAAKAEEQNRHQLEQQLVQAQKMEAVGTMASGVAHDFNNILQGLSGYLNIIQSKNKDPEQEKPIGEMNRLVDRAAELISGLLTFSRRVKPNLKRVDLNAEIEQTVMLLERTLPKMIRIELKLHPDIDKIKGDSNQIEQVLLNLANNARDAMPEGGVLGIATSNIILTDPDRLKYPEAIPGRYVHLSITDTGQGMDPETLDNIFAPFFTTKGPGVGTGLGLSTVYGIVKSHGGLLTCCSVPGRGTEFEVLFPPLDDNGVETGSGPMELVMAAGGTETILLVDDEAFIRETAAEFLVEYGYRVLTASSGEEALAVYRNPANQIDMVMLDISMPGMGGRRCLEDLIEQNSEAKVLIASGYASSELESELRRIGAKGFINKPFRMATLLKQIRSILD